MALTEEAEQQMARVETSVAAMNEKEKTIAGIKLATVSIHSKLIYVRMQAVSHPRFSTLPVRVAGMLGPSLPFSSRWQECRLILYPSVLRRQECSFLLYPSSSELESEYLLSQYKFTRKSGRWQE